MSKGLIEGRKSVVKGLINKEVDFSTYGVKRSSKSVGKGLIGLTVIVG